MEDIHPNHIMTDQEQAMSTAISTKFPASIHMCCMYHVLNVAKINLGPMLVDDHPFANAF
jgi:hypothetical protein